MWGKAKEWMSKKYQEVKVLVVAQTEMSQPSENPRLSSYLDYRLNDTIVHYIEVDNTRLHFQAFNEEQTVQTLQDQYVKFHGKEMILENEDVKISPTMPLNQILVSTQNRQIFQDIVQKLQRKQKVEVAVIPPQKKENFIQIVKKCNGYSSFQCTIEMKNGLRKPLRSKMTVTANTTLRQMIDELNKHPLVEGKDIQFFNEEGQLIDPETYGKSFESLAFKEKILRAQYSYRNSLLRRNSVVWVKRFQDGNVHIDSIKQMPKDEVIFSYNSKEMRMDRNKLGNYRQELVTHFFRVVLSLKMKEIEDDSIPIAIQATGTLRLFVLTKQFEEIWMPIQKLTKQNVIGGVHPRRNEFAIYQIDAIQQITLEQPEPFYSLEVLPSHHFIANKIIIHNCDSFTICAKYFGDDPREEEVRFYRSDPISKHFGEQVCQVGGFTLNNRMTFGDYQLDQFQIIYVYQGQSLTKTNTRQHTISQWRKASINRDQTEPAHLEQFNKKIQEEYFGIYNRRIIPTAQIETICKEKQIGVINVLVALRMHFERIYYYLNKEPNYADRDQERYKHHHPDFQHKENYKKGLTYGKKAGLQDIDILGIHLYTANTIYKPLNQYLRLEYVKNIQEKDDQYLPDAGWIARSTKKANPYRGVTYRGVGRIDLKKALNLDRHCPQIEGRDPEYRDKFIIFNNFTSTSKEQKVARHFLPKDVETNCLLKIIVNKGFEVEQFSQYPEEKQVLILPFTYFIINNYNLNGPLQTAQLEQIPMPQKNSDKLIFWVDDEPEYNEQIKAHFQNQGIEVVQVTSTRIMRVILQNFFWIFKMLGRKVVIISDMVREEYGVTNYMAGVDLFQNIFTDYGLSNKAIIFASDKARAENNLRERGVVDGNWVVLTQSKELISVVLEQFSKM